jgi:hypothetical protein
MSTLKQVRAAVGTTVNANISSPNMMVYSRVPANPIVPCLVVVPATADYLLTMNRGGDDWYFDLHILVPSADDDVGQDLLDEYVAGRGARSIVTIVHANPSLGLADVSAVVTGMTAYNYRFDAVGVAHIGATLRLRVVLSNF